MEDASRRKFGKQLAKAIAILPIASMVSEAQEANRQKPRRRRGRGRKPREEGSPIMVGGGGGGGIGDEDKTNRKNRCKFKQGDQYYKDHNSNSGDEKSFTNRGHGWRVKTFRITTESGTDDFSSSLNSPADCEIRVRCNGNDDDVTIFSNRTEMGLTMNTRSFKPDPTLPDVHENPDMSSWVKEVELYVAGDSKLRVTYKVTDRAIVCVDWKEKSTMSCAI